MRSLAKADIVYYTSVHRFPPAFCEVQKMKRIAHFIHRTDLLIFLFVIFLYFSSHLINFSTAPWNQNGLFDDAAWDIYFAKNHIFAGIPFQAAYFDNVGLISREVVFHYYISIFFRLFGYNLLVFNISLLILGFITVLFTVLIIQRLFKNVFITILSAIIINFFPLHFLHIFAGHRYAIAAPLMVISLYYLYTALANNSRFRAFISAFSATLCLDSAIMGKQYIYGLILSAICISLSRNTQWKSRKNISLFIFWVIFFFISSSPLFIYIASNYSLYNIRETSLIHDFLQKFQDGGFVALQPYFDQIKEIFFAKHSYRRWFLPDFYIIPLPYYIFIIPGLILAWFKKRFEIVFLSLIPILGAFISGGYDFRVLLAAPIWVICIAFNFNFLRELFPKKYFLFVATTILIIISFGLFPSIKYIFSISENPNSLWLLPHKDVAISRLTQDIVVGASNPNSAMKWNELNREINPKLVTHDTLVCPLTAYAIMHLYLQNYDDKKILSFINQGTQFLSTPEEILSYNTQAIANYVPTNKDLKMVWEISEKTKGIIKAFSEYNKYGSGETISDTVDNVPFSLFVLTIKNEYLNQFKKEVAAKFQVYEN